MSWITTAKFCALWLLPSFVGAADILVADFESGDLSHWQSEEFEGRTEYRLVSIDGVRALAATATNSASGRVRKIRIDLDKTPFLHWRWRVEPCQGGGDETSKAGDDYVARLYVIVSGGLRFWRTRALNYVWSCSQPVGSRWDNAFTANAQMWALRSGPAEAGRWLTEVRNVKADLKTVFGEDIRHLDAIAIMTDSDNSGGVHRAYYGNIAFRDHRESAD